LNHFETLIKEGVEGKLPIRSSGLEEFLAPTQPQQISELFQNLWNSRRSGTNAPEGQLHMSAPATIPGQPGASN